MHTHTYATLGVSKECFTEICEAFRKLGKELDPSYFFEHDGEHECRTLDDTPTVLDMHGIGLVIKEEKEEELQSSGKPRCGYHNAQKNRCCLKAKHKGLHEFINSEPE